MIPIVNLQSPPPTHLEQTQLLSPAAEKYLEEAFDIIQKNSVKRDEVDWVALRKKAFKSVEGATSPADTYQAIRLILFFLEDGHSFFLTPEKASEFKQYRPESIDSIEKRGCLIDSDIGYILVPSFMSWSSEAMSDYASSLQEMIVELDKNGLNKWILDLRGNSGGCLMPMMMGLSPFFDRSEILEAFGLSNYGDSFFYNEKRLNIKELDILCTLKSDPYHLQNPHPQIALLMDRYTGSSGEAVAIAFLGLQNVRTFGQKTAGCTSGNVNYTLPDGAEIILAYNYMTDLKGRVYKMGIAPEEETSGDALDAAKTWLKRSS